METGVQPEDQTRRTLYSGGATVEGSKRNILSIVFGNMRQHSVHALLYLQKLIVKRPCPIPVNAEKSIESRAKAKSHAGPYYSTYRG